MVAVTVEISLQTIQKGLPTFKKSEIIMIRLLFS